MKATIEPVQERKVTVEMTESEAKVIKQYVAKIRDSNWYQFIDDYSPDFSYRKLYDSLFSLYDALDGIH